MEKYIEWMKRKSKWKTEGRERVWRAREWMKRTSERVEKGGREGGSYRGRVCPVLQGEGWSVAGQSSPLAEVRPCLLPP